MPVDDAGVRWRLVHAVWRNGTRGALRGGGAAVRGSVITGAVKVRGERPVIAIVIAASAAAVLVFTGCAVGAIFATTAAAAIAATTVSSRLQASKDTKSR